MLTTIIGDRVVILIIAIVVFLTNLPLARLDCLSTLKAECNTRPAAVIRSKTTMHKPINRLGT